MKSLKTFFCSKFQTKMSTSSSTTFKVYDIPAEFDTFKQKDDEQHMVTYLKGYNENKCIRILQGTKFIGNVRPESNGFIHTVLNAYNHHQNLVIRPDDIWLAIMTQFSFYVNAKAEEFRGMFVNFEGQKELIVNLNGTLTDDQYDRFVEIMTEEIHKNLVDDEVKNWVLPNFSTTTKDDNITCGVVLMATMKKYFRYTRMMCCGLPFLTLEGTIEDWKEIKRRLEKLRSYGLDDWVNYLDLILDEFVQAKLGNINLDFWQKICHYERFGSGGQKLICGWIAAFLYFDGNGVQQCRIGDGSSWPQVRLDNVTTGVVEVDVKIDDNGTVYKSVMFAGHMAGEVLEDGKTLQPRSGWVIALKPDDADHQ